jgi:hypothetical protein
MAQADRARFRKLWPELQSSYTIKHPTLHYVLQIRHNVKNT